MRISFSAITAAALLWSGSCAAIHAQSSSHVIQTPGEAQWGPAPPMLPAGAQIAVLAGDPTKPVPYTIRLNFPAGAPSASAIIMLSRSTAAACESTG